MTRMFACIALAALVSGIAAGQTPDAAPKFQIADVHVSPHSTNPNMRAGFYRGGRYEIRSATMVDLIAAAYGVDTDKVFGGPAWLEFDRFDIIATAPATSTPDAVRAMLQSLLADRFSLIAHLDKKEMPSYALTVGKKPLLKEAEGSGETGCNVEIQGMGNGRGGPPPPDTPPALPTFAYTCRNMTMAAFAEAIHTMIVSQQYVGVNPILDDTGLKGAWNFDFHYSLPAGMMGPGSSAGTSMLEAVDKQLGLKLEPRKVPIPVINVDRVNQKPTANLPGVTEKLPVAPTEFEVADIKPSDPNASQAQNRSPFLPGGRLDIKGFPLKQLILVAFDLTSPAYIVGGPKFMDDARFDILAKAPAQTVSTTASNGMNGPPPVDIDALRLMLKALLIDRFNLKTHFEDRPMDAYTLVAAKPKLKKADPSNRTGFKEGPGPDGKDPRKESPQLGRLVTCQNMTMAQFAQLLPNIAGGYFQTVSRTVVDSTGLGDAFDFTLSFSGAGILNGGGGGRGGDGPPQQGGPNGPAAASDPGGGISLMDAMEKQIGIKMEIQKRPVPVLVIDHIDPKPTDN